MLDTKYKIVYREIHKNCVELQSCKCIYQVSLCLLFYHWEQKVFLIYGSIEGSEI